MDITGEVIGELEFFSDIRLAALNPKVNLVALAQENGYISGHRFDGIAIWSHSHSIDVESMTWSSDGKFLLLYSNSGDTIVLEREEGGIVNKVSGKMLDHIDMNLNILDKDYGFVLQANGKDISLFKASKYLGFCHQTLISWDPSIGLSLTNVTHESVTSSKDIAKINDLRTNFKSLTSTFNRLKSKLEDFTWERLQTMYTCCEKDIFDDFTDCFGMTNFRHIEGQYLEQRTVLISLLGSFDDPTCQAYGQKLINSLNEYQKDWDTLILWLRILQQSPLTIQEWQSKITTRRMSGILEIVKTDYENGFDVIVAKIIDRMLDLISKDGDVKVSLELVGSLIPLNGVIDSFITYKSATILHVKGITSIDISSGQVLKDDRTMSNTSDLRLFGSDHLIDPSGHIHEMSSYNSNTANPLHETCYYYSGHKRTLLTVKEKKRIIIQQL